MQLENLYYKPENLLALPQRRQIAHPYQDAALSLSGDMTKFGNRRKVKVIRNQRDSNTVYYVDLTEKSILNSSRFMLQPHDVIYVGPLRKKFYAFNNITNIVSMSISAVTLFLLINQN